MNEVKPGNSAAAANFDNPLREEVNAIGEDLRKMKETAADAARHAAAAARTGASQVKDRAGNIYDSAKERVGNAYESARGTAQDAIQTAGDQTKLAARNVERKIEDNPLMAVGIAFGVGVLLGALIRSRD